MLELGNLEAKRDWGFAGDYVEGMWRMLQRDEPDDFVLATGTTTSVQSFCELAAEAFGFKLAWEGEGQNTKAIDCRSGKTIISVNPKYCRPAEVDILHGNATKAKQQLGWEPTTRFEDMICEMVDADLRRLGARPRLPRIVRSQRRSTRSQLQVRLPA